jgi:hypothetical protein
MHPNFNDGKQEHRRVPERHNAAEKSGKRARSTGVHGIREAAQSRMQERCHGQLDTGHQSGREDCDDIEKMGLHGISMRAD